MTLCCRNALASTSRRHRSQASEVRCGRNHGALLRQQMEPVPLRLDRASNVAHEQVAMSVRRAAILRSRAVRYASIANSVSSSFAIVADCCQQDCDVAAVMQSQGLWQSLLG